MQYLQYHKGHLEEENTAINIINASQVDQRKLNGKINQTCVDRTLIIIGIKTAHSQEQ
jgi:hypothetical protein